MNQNSSSEVSKIRNKEEFARRRNIFESASSREDEDLKLPRNNYTIRNFSRTATYSSSSSKSNYGPFGVSYGSSSREIRLPSENRDPKPKPRIGNASPVPVNVQAQESITCTTVVSSSPEKIAAKQSISDRLNLKNEKSNPVIENTHANKNIEIKEDDVFIELDTNTQVSSKQVGPEPTHQKFDTTVNTGSETYKTQKSNNNGTTKSNNNMTLENLEIKKLSSNPVFEEKIGAILNSKNNSANNSPRVDRKSQSTAGAGVYTPRKSGNTVAVGKNNLNIENDQEEDEAKFLKQKMQEFNSGNLVLKQTLSDGTSMLLRKDHATGQIIDSAGVGKRISLSNSVSSESTQRNTVANTPATRNYSVGQNTVSGRTSVDYKVNWSGCVDLWQEV